MLYRIQTIYLLIIVFLSCIAFNKYPFIKDMHYDANNCKIIKFFYLITCLLSFICIFLHKKILYQKYINIINLYLNFFIFLFITYQQLFLIKLYNYHIINILFHILLLIFLFLIHKNILKDINLINSINRLR